ncbi:hypothetical protein [Haloferula sargassicola]
MKTIASAACSIAIVFLIAERANSAVVRAFGGFSVMFDPSHPAFQGVEEFTGDWSFQFDDHGGAYSGIVSGDSLGINFYTINRQVVDATGIDVGSNFFDSSNITASVAMTDGLVTTIQLSGAFAAPYQDFLLLTYVNHAENGLTGMQVNESLLSVRLGVSTSPLVNDVEVFNVSQGEINPLWSYYGTVPEPTCPALGGFFVVGSCLVRNRRMMR